MITDPQGAVLAAFAAFCRIGGCMMALPGFASGRIPSTFRLFVAVAVSLALLPLLWDEIYPRTSTAAQATYFGIIATETLIGSVFGLIARFYVLGLQFAGAVLSSSMSFNAPGGQDVLEDTQDNALTTMLSFGGLLVLFILDFHHIVFRALLDSYGSIPFGSGMDPQRMLITLTDTLRATWMIMLRLSSPFILYGLMFNFGVGLVNKLAPQVPVFFISLPFALTGGLFLMYISVAAIIRQFADGFLPVFNSF